MWLRNEDHSVLVSPQGGSILQWQWQERVILGPARVVRVDGELKTRGETHWCYPNFGTIREPKYVGSSPQHGMLRNSVSNILRHSGSSATFEMFLTSNGNHVTDVLYATTNVLPNGVQMSLCGTNDTLERVPILPAIHPYFAVPPDGFSLIVGGNNHPTEDMIIERCGLPVFVYLHGIGRVELKISEDCSHVVVWSDNSSAYVCVEPVFGKPGTYGTDEGRWLEPGETTEPKVEFRFKLD